MTARPSDFPATKLGVRLTPRAAADAVLLYENGTLFLRLTASPVEGVANAACCKYVANLLGIAPSRVTVQTGLKSRDKVRAIEELPQEALEATPARSMVSGKG